MYGDKPKQSEEGRVTYKDFIFQCLQSVHKLVVDTNLDVMSTRQVSSCCLRPHSNKTVVKNWLLSKSKSQAQQHQYQFSVTPSCAPDHCMQLVPSGPVIKTGI